MASRRLEQISGVLESGLSWQPNEKIRTVRLLGKQPLRAFDRDVALVFLASHAIEQLVSRTESQARRISEATQL